MKKIGIVFNGRGHGMPEVCALGIAVFAVIGAYCIYNFIQRRNSFSQNL